MNILNIVIQSDKDDKDLYRKGKLSDGLTVAIIQNGTTKGQLALEFFISIDGHVTSAVVTENNFEGLIGAFVGAKMRFDRMISSETSLINHYLTHRLIKVLRDVPNDGSLFTRSDVVKYLHQLTKD